MPLKGTTEARGYGHTHKLLRKQWVKKITAGGVNCWRCHLPITPDQPFDLGHDDNDRTLYRGPEHRACNRGTAGRKNGINVITARDW